MDTQFIIMIALFAMALVYVGRKFYNSITKHGSEGGSCSKCVHNIENMPEHKA